MPKPPQPSKNSKPNQKKDSLLPNSSNKLMQQESDPGQRQSKQTQVYESLLSKRDKIKADYNDFTESYGRKLIKEEEPEFHIKDCWDFVISDVIATQATHVQNRTKNLFNYKKQAKIIAAHLCKKQRLKEQEDIQKENTRKEIAKNLSKTVFRNFWQTTFRIHKFSQQQQNKVKEREDQQKRLEDLLKKQLELSRELAYVLKSKDDDDFSDQEPKALLAAADEDFAGREEKIGADKKTPIRAGRRNVNNKYATQHQGGPGEPNGEKSDRSGKPRENIEVANNEVALSSKTSTPIKKKPQKPTTFTLTTPPSGLPDQLIPNKPIIWNLKLLPNQKLQFDRISQQTPTKSPRKLFSDKTSDNPYINTRKINVSLIESPILLRGDLREYQFIGLKWLLSLHQKKLNGILADEMGLGKTIQTIALISYLAGEMGIWGPHLIVVPTTLLMNWEMEFKRWAPGLKIFTYFGRLNERKEKRKGWSS